MEAAMDEKSGAENKLLKIPGVTAVDVGYKYVNGQRTNEIAIRVHVAKKKKAVDKKDMIPAEINGIKTDVIEGTYDPQIVSEKKNLTFDAQADTTNYRPLQGGISIGPDRSVGGLVFAGTLGCMVTDNTNGRVMMLSNFHVMCIDNSWHPGDQMNQPSLIDTGTHASGVGTLLRAVLSSHVDGAVANINPAIGKQASVVSIGNVAGTASAVLGAAVRKRGRTTLLTFGFIDGLNASVNVNYGGAIGTRTLTNQITIATDTAHNPMFSDHGDSGSVIMDSSNNVVGLLFAGSGPRTIANPIAFVESELNVRVQRFVKNIKLEIKEVKEFKQEKNEIKEHKIEKAEIKELKLEKNEGKEHKIEKLEQKEIKEHKIEKAEQKELKEHKEFKEIDKPNKEIDKIRDKLSDKNFDNPGPGPFQPPINPGGLQSTDLEERIQQLENALSGLTSFIETNLRPDLSQGGLTNE